MQGHVGRSLQPIGYLKVVPFSNEFEVRVAVVVLPQLPQLPHQTLPLPPRKYMRVKRTVSLAE